MAAFCQPYEEEETDHGVLMRSGAANRSGIGSGIGAFSDFFDEMADSTHSMEHAGCFQHSGEEDDVAILSNFNNAIRGGRMQEEFYGSLPTGQDTCVTFYKRKQPKILKGRYLLGDTIGKGSYGKVKDCIELTSLRRYAMKIVSRMNVRKIPGGMRHVENEIQLMRTLQHPNVVALIDDFNESDGEKRCMVLQYCLGSIHDLQANGIVDSQQYRQLPEWQAHAYFIQVIEGVDYLHSQRVIHKDLKPGNMLLTEHEIVKIIDFGVSEQLSLFAQSDEVSGGQTTPAMQPPEVAMGLDRFSGFKLDVYSCGVSLFFMLTGNVPFSHPNMLQIFERIAEGKYVIPDYVSEPAAALIRGMMCHSPETRFSVGDVRAATWFTVAPPCSGPKLEPLSHLTSGGNNPLTVVNRLKVLYDWELGSDAEEEEILAHDMTYTHLNDTLHRMGIGGTDDPLMYDEDDRFYQQYHEELYSEQSRDNEPETLPDEPVASVEPQHSTSRQRSSSRRHKVKLKKPSFCSQS